MNVKIKKLVSEAVIPSYAKDGDAALDLTATSYEYKDGRHVYGTGLAIEIPEGYIGLIFPRSSICKYDLRLSNSVGVIDSGYRGEIKFFFENDNIIGRGKLSETLYRVNFTGVTGTKMSLPANEPLVYKVGDRIGQIIILPYPKISLQEVEQLSDTDRGTDGVGSSGS